MKKLQLDTREIGTVKVFDISGDPTDGELQEIANKIQKKIRRHRLQRVILNLQNVNAIDPIGMRKLMAAFLRPQRSLIYGASDETIKNLQASYLPRNVRVCLTEEEVAADFGPFLLEKETEKEIACETLPIHQESIGAHVERRRSKRMHVAIPVELKMRPANSEKELCVHALITNISEGGLFCEFLDTQQADLVNQVSSIDELSVEIKIPKCTNFPEDYEVCGVVKRKELRKKQLGLAIEFVVS